MSIKLKRATAIPSGDSLVILMEKGKKPQITGLSKEQLAYIANAGKQDAPNPVHINNYSRHYFFVLTKKGAKDATGIEAVRRDGALAFEAVNAEKLSKITIVDEMGDNDAALALAEGMALASYQFLKYFKDAKERKHKLTSIGIHSKGLATKAVNELQALVEATMHARTLVNEPVSFLTARQFSKEMQALGRAAGFKVEVFNKKKIETLKMGGLLAVNYGSPEPPTFNILEWKPTKPKNKKPIILVGKGVVYDTGGLSLKPTPNSMDIMKCDMGGGAAMVGTMYALAKNKLPLHVIALVPATDNRPGLNAYAPGDVIHMYSGKTVEVLNTDAEGRMIMADALAYASKYNPQLVLDAATLTGAAARAIGRQGVVAMGTAGDKVMGDLKTAGSEVHERVAEFPFWTEYGDDIKSTIADIKNLGGPEAGAITAGKFLEHFTDYPWIHVDIAGPAWLDKEDAYRTQGGSGVGVRLFYTFLKNMI